jgi:hypothetical protein
MGDQTDNNVAYIQYNHPSNFMNFRTNNLDRMRIDASGNVGIGTAAPGANLDVAATTGSVIRLTSTSTAVSADDPIGLLQFYGSDASAPGAGVKSKIAAYAALGSGDGSYLTLSTSDGVTNDIERLRIDSSGNVGIGTSSPAEELHIAAAIPTIRLEDTDDSSYGEILYNTGSGGLLLRSDQSNSAASASNIIMQVDGTERMRITSAGNVGIGTSSPDYRLDVESASGIALQAISGTGGIAALFKNNSSGTAAIEFAGTTTTNNVRIGAFGDVFTLNTGGSERARIDSSGNLLVGKTATSFGTAGVVAYADGGFTATKSSDAPVGLNRLSTDGNLVEFSQAGTLEGTISVSGTTVSYNGGHLSRWAQFPDNSRPELLKGTVMSNLDQMSNWDQEDNEQLNCVEVSAVEGDANVAGVFVAWDSTDDGYNDILLAMTGDMVIRIAGGTTVQRGDLLMSAGDGTAKPQGDDIVRSKTIAKVTSTHVSHTYADGSYAVPCVLMAC